MIVVRCLAIMITSLYKLRYIDGIKITMIDSSLDKSQIQIDRSIYIYVLIVPSFYTYTYITMAEGLKKVFAAKKEQVSLLSSDLE